MEQRMFAILMLVELVFIGGLFLLYPRITRRGLLFGVYVGEEASRGDEAARITSGWYRGMIAILAVCLLGGLAGAFLAPSPWVSLFATFLLIGGFVAMYLWAYRRARALAPTHPAIIAAAPLATAPPPRLALPVAVLAIGLALGFFTLAYTLAHYDALPARVPVHFGASGKPDGWATKSVGSVMTMPLMNIALALLLGGSTFFTATAKRAIRWPDGGPSIEAQERFRRAMTRFMAGVALLTTGMITVLGVGSVQVGLGETDGLTPWMMVLAGAIVVYTLGGSLYLAVRYGQGGARLESAGASAPLTDGLADNRFWKLGVFYVNRDDPSFLVEHRFGLGYTLNLGNIKAVLLFVGILVVMLGLSVWTIVASRR